MALISNFLRPCFLMGLMLGLQSMGAYQLRALLGALVGGIGGVVEFVTTVSCGVVRTACFGWNTGSLYSALLTVLKQHHSGGLTADALAAGPAGNSSRFEPFLMLFANEPASAAGSDAFQAAWFLAAAVYGLCFAVLAEVLPILVVGSAPGVVPGGYCERCVPGRGMRIGPSFLLFATGIKLA